MPSVCVISGASQYHEKRWGMHLIGINFRSHGFEASHAFFNECVTAKFHFNEAVFPISEVYHRITLLPIFIPIMIYFSVQSIRKHTQVPDAKCFKKKSKCVKVIH